MRLRSIIVLGGLLLLLPPGAAYAQQYGAWAWSVTRAGSFSVPAETRETAIERAYNACVASTGASDCAHGAHAVIAVWGVGYRLTDADPRDV
jgi:hypothetical protein